MVSIISERSVPDENLQGWGYPVSMLDNFLLVLFEKYAQLLKRRFSEDFQEVRDVLLSTVSLWT